MKVYDPSKPNEFAYFYHIKTKEKEEQKQRVIQEAMEAYKQARPKSKPAVVPARSTMPRAPPPANSAPPISETADEAYARRAAMSRSIGESAIRHLQQSLPRQSRFDQPPQPSAKEETTSCAILIEGAVKDDRPDLSAAEENELQKDMVRQCNKYGVVVDYRFLPATRDIRVVFKTNDQAARAQKKINGRNFDGLQLCYQTDSAAPKEGKRYQASIQNWTVNAKEIPKIEHQRPSQGSRLPGLPLEILLMIARHIDTFSLYRLSLTCFPLRSTLLGSPVFWLARVWDTDRLKQMQNKHLEKILSYSQGIAKDLCLSGLRNITSGLFQSISKTRFIPKKLESISLADMPKVSGSSICAYLSSFGVKDTLRKITLTSLSGLDDASLGLLLKSMNRVEEYTLDGCSNISDQAFLVPKKALSIKVMSVRSCNLSDVFVQRLTQVLAARTLEALDVAGCKKITKSCLVLLRSCPRLSKLELTGINHQVPSDVDTNAALVSLAQACPSLSSFQWKYNPFLGNESIQALVHHAAVSTLVVDSSARIGVQGFVSLVEGTTPLQVLGLKQCPGITSAVFSQLLLSSNGSALLKLDISGNVWFKDEHIALIAQNLPRLAILHMNGCKSITSLGLDSLLAKTGRPLMEIGLSDNPHISVSCLDRLKARFGSRAVIAYANT
ncbi:hypothetical protein HDU91_003236 [Kappamyces sp. JEL0680]|nr:hypothetical protein HDU91_003236 [Kappamyces sp. JEL0680]